MTEAFIGLDLGTTSIKAVAFDRDEVVLATAVVPTPTHHLGDGGAEYDAHELWNCACRVLRSVTDQLMAAGHAPAAIATASMGESGVLVDAAGSPVAPVIAWFDRRTKPQQRWWIEQVGIERTLQIAGIWPHGVYSATKMLWTREHLPDAWGRARHWLNIADWITFRLTGEMATDHSLASRTLLFDLSARRWSHELVGSSGLDPSLLAPLIESGQPVAAVHADAASQTGVPVGTVVGAGGQDHVCAALALDVTEPGTVLDSIGTAEAFFIVTDGVDRRGCLAEAGCVQGAHVEPGRVYAMTGLPLGGGRIDAARLALGLDWDAFLATPEAERAIDEVAHAGQTCLESMLEVIQTTSVRHVATGGGARNARLIDRKRNIGGRPIEVASLTEATALGAARLARRAADGGPEER